eukprot:Anaeramoba_ignava/a347252_2133.p2 GENE.a347252_2133~~a347252_2133.p2  ORF type:complete len:158 (+),score=49.62 a347252_2133:112-585(+)
MTDSNKPLLEDQTQNNQQMMMDGQNMNFMQQQYPPQQQFQQYPPQQQQFQQYQQQQQFQPQPQPQMNNQNYQTDMSDLVVTKFKNALPTKCQCPHCKNVVVTQVKFEPGSLTWLLCILMAIFGCWLCCCIPFCVDSLQDAHHICPSCGRKIGVFTPL